MGMAFVLLPFTFCVTMLCMCACTPRCDHCLVCLPFCVEMEDKMMFWVLFGLPWFMAETEADRHETGFGWVFRHGAVYPGVVCA